MSAKRLFLFFVLVFSLPVFAGQGEWVAAGSGNGIDLYTREVLGQELKDFRGVMRVNVPMESVLAVLSDVRYMPAWFYQMRSARVIGSTQSQQNHVYLVIKGIWPVSDRDAVARVGYSQDSSSLAVNITAVAEPDFLPRVEGKVRIPRMLSGWTVTPLPSGGTEIQLNGNADPGGRIPVWLANMVVTLMPRETLKMLRQRLQDPALVAASLEFARKDEWASQMFSRLRLK